MATASTSLSSTDKVLARVEGGIGWITLNNPERRNAISLAMWQAIGEVMEAFEADPEVRLAVISGAGGRAFAAGADISEFESNRANSQQKAEYGLVASRGQRALAQFSKPFIGMIQGFCIGGGLAVALSTDVRFASSDSRFGIPAAKLGLGYDYGGLAHLARLVGPSAAADIMFSARQLEADEALRIGLINRVVPVDQLEAQVREYAATIAANAPLTVRAAKAALRAWAHHEPNPRTEAIDTLVKQCFDSEDYKEGRTAFLEKRKPQFKGR